MRKKNWMRFLIGETLFIMVGITISTASVGSGGLRMRQHKEITVSIPISCVLNSMNSCWNYWIHMCEDWRLSIIVVILTCAGMLGIAAQRSMLNTLALAHTRIVQIHLLRMYKCKNVELHCRAAGLHLSPFDMTMKYTHASQDMVSSASSRIAPHIYLHKMYSYTYSLHCG